MPHPSSSSSSAAGSTPFGHTSIPSALASSLQSRSLTEEDYDLLLSLDTPPQRSQPPGGGVTRGSQSHSGGVAERSQPHGEGVAERVIASMHVEPLDGHHPLVVGGACCQLCGRGYSRGDWIKKLPCKHKVSCKPCSRNTWTLVH